MRVREDIETFPSQYFPRIKSVRLSFVLVLILKVSFSIYFNAESETS